MRLSFLLSLFFALPVPLLAQGLWRDHAYTGRPWTEDVSRPVAPTAGMQGRHIALWASHGRYYDGKKGEWRWQRPNLFCTNEDLFTQTIVVPCLIPMLERAGAVVYTPRERDPQPVEIIIDNESPAPAYAEYKGKRRWKRTAATGFSPAYALRPAPYALKDGENPFGRGTVATVKGATEKKQSLAVYRPRFAKAGRYAVYVSYTTTAKSTDRALYTVCHKGQQTRVLVNQRMGGGTWVYLGTYDFDRGQNPYNQVVVSNAGPKRSLVSTDAVRFGGGMGNIQRGGTVSGLPRSLEGARYFAQWAGAPRTVYAGYDGKDDYSDDINTRGNMVNWLAGGSPYVPAGQGLGVPLELSLAVHSDAGVASDLKSVIGTLAICTTAHNGGRLGAGGSRTASRTLADALWGNLDADLRAQFGTWTKRAVWDRNYSETRRPEVPSAIIETLSHQNFPDMRMAQDPVFKQAVARSLYKTILRYTAAQHGAPCVVQPLRPTAARVELRTGGRARLTWLPVNDPREPTAKPTRYIIYMATGTGGFDNGTAVAATACDVQLEPGVLYRFRISAANAGGESETTETLAALWRRADAKTVLVVNGFQRLAAPAVIDEPGRQGFDFDADPGVWQGLTTGWVGRQQCFNTARAGIEDETGLGYTDETLAGRQLMGNTFDYIAEHAAAIATTVRYNIVSCASPAFTAATATARYDCIDWIGGLQCDDGHSLVRQRVFTPAAQQRLRLLAGRGTALLVSGAFVASDMQRSEDARFLHEVLKTEVPAADDCAERGAATVAGLGMRVPLFCQLNDTHYAATRCDRLAPVAPAFVAMKYDSPAATQHYAATAYQGPDYRSFVCGFPIECIADIALRDRLMRGVLQFLMP